MKDETSTQRESDAGNQHTILGGEARDDEWKRRTGRRVSMPAVVIFLSFHSTTTTVAAAAAAVSSRDSAARESQLTSEEDECSVGR